MGPYVGCGEPKDDYPECGDYPNSDCWSECPSLREKRWPEAPALVPALIAVATGLSVSVDSGCGIPGALVTRVVERAWWVLYANLDLVQYAACAQGDGVTDYQTCIQNYFNGTSSLSAVAMANPLPAPSGVKPADGHWDDPSASYPDGRMILWCDAGTWLNAAAAAYADPASATQPESYYDAGLAEVILHELFHACGAAADSRPSSGVTLRCYPAYRGSGLFQHLMQERYGTSVVG